VRPLIIIANYAMQCSVVLRDSLALSVGLQSVNWAPSLTTISKSRNATGPESQAGTDIASTTTPSKIANCAVQV